MFDFVSSNGERQRESVARMGNARSTIAIEKKKEDRDVTSVSLYSCERYALKKRERERETTNVR